jgi:hypothetical protein
MQGFIKVSWKIAFTYENYAQQPTQVVVPWEHLSCGIRSSFPEQGVTCHIFLHSAEVCPSKRDQSLVAQLSDLSRPHFLGVGPSHWSKPITAFSVQRMPTQFTHSRLCPWYSPPTMKYLGASCGLMSTHASVLVDSVGPPSAEACRAAASFP